MRLMLVFMATFACGCVEDSESETPVRETGYLECAISADCAGDLRCLAPDGSAECVDTGGGACLGDFCECWAAQFCAEGDACVSGDERFECIPQDAVEFPLTAVHTHGVCAMPGDATRMEIGLLLGSAGRPNVSDTDRVEGLDAQLGAVLSADDFAFTALPGRAFMGPEPATATRDQAVIGVTPTPTDLRYDAAPPPAERLLVLAVDHSGSLIGEDPVSGEIDLNAATDIRDERIAFLRMLTLWTDPNTFMSLVAFNGQLPIIDPEHSVPTRNRDVIARALTSIESGSTGTTPLVRTLTDLRARVIAPSPELQASVLLFTDGVEAGDPTDPGAGMDAEIAAYEAAGIPVFVVQLRPPATAGHDRERDPKLMELACRTGGEYVFIEQPEEFSDPRSNAAGWLAARQAGVWRLTVDVPELDDQPAGFWAIATRLALQLGDISAEVDLSVGEAGREFDDTRLWMRRD